MLHYARFLPLPVAIFLIGTFVMRFFALGYANFHFNLAP